VILPSARSLPAFVLSLLTASAAISASAMAQAAPDASWDVTVPRGQTREPLILRHLLSEVSSANLCPPLLIGPLFLAPLAEEPAEESKRRSCECQKWERH
jgi:hypothetical protein